MNMRKDPKYCISYMIVALYDLKVLRKKRPYNIFQCISYKILKNAVINIEEGGFDEIDREGNWNKGR